MKTIEARISEANPDYRFYTCDYSVQGRCAIMLTLQGEAKEDWHLQGETLNNIGQDIRQPLFVNAVESNFENALQYVLAEIAAVNNRTNRKEAK